MKILLIYKLLIVKYYCNLPRYVFVFRNCFLWTIDDSKKKNATLNPKIATTDKIR